MDFFYHCIKFEYNHDFVKFLVEIFCALSVFVVLSSKVSFIFTLAFQQNEEILRYATERLRKIKMQS